MNRYFVLVKVMLISINMFSIKSGKTFVSKMKAIVIPAIILFAFLPMVLGIGTITHLMYKVMSEMGQEGLVLGMGFSITSMTVFFFCIFYVMSVFYFSKDIENLLPLPLKPSEILAAKFTVTLLYEYLTELVFLAPVLISFGVTGNFGIVYYLYSVIVFLVLPLLPLVYASILSMLFMRFTNLAKNRDRFRIVGGVIAMLLAVGINAAVTRFSGSSMSSEQLQQLLDQGNNSYVELITGIFFTNRFAVMALLNSGTLKGLVNLVLFVLICLLFVALFLSFGESMYFKGVVGMSEAYAKRKRFTEEELARSSGQRSAIKAYAMKELKLLFRTPVYFMNCVLMNFIFPVFLILPFITQSDEMPEFQGLSALASSERGSAMTLAIAFGISVFVTATNGIAASSISREGTNIFVCKYLPISYKTQIMAKVLSSMALGAVGTFSMLVTALLFFRIKIHLVLIIAVVSFLGIAFSSLAGVLIDLGFPKLVWDNEQKAIKQNFNVVLNMLLSVLMAGIPIFTSIALKFTLPATFLVIAALFSILDLLLYNILSSAGVRMFERIEG